MLIFLDTSVLSHKSLSELSGKLAERVSAGDAYLISVLTHFEILWGYRKAGLASSRYEGFLEKLAVEIAPLTEEDAVFAAKNNPPQKKLVDALIAATVARYNASVWTKDADFKQFLPKGRVMIL